jgi:hypothetical protein
VVTGGDIEEDLDVFRFISLAFRWNCLERKFQRSRTLPLF